MNRIPLGGTVSLRKHRRRFNRKAPMTVCIAAICNNSDTIFGACDRMLTAGDIEFEPALRPVATSNMAQTTNPKIVHATSSIVIMTAGDSALQTEITDDVKSEVRERIKGMKSWLPVKEVVGIYVEAYNRAKAARLNNSVLVPLGLNSNTFVSRQSEMSAAFIAETSTRIRQFEFEFMSSHGVETIITGIDATGPHIYTVFKCASGDAVMCCDALGFAAVGSGSRHAESQFMMSGHGPFSDREETLLLTYVAKKRSEVAPGVGRATELFVAGPAPGSVAMMANIADFSLVEIDKIYQKMEKEQETKFRGAMEKTRRYVASIFEERSKKEAALANQQPIPGIDADAPPENPHLK